MEVTWNIPEQLLNKEVDATIVDMEVNSKGLNVEVETDLKDLGVTDETKTLRVMSRAYYGSPGHKVIVMLIEHGFGTKISAGDRDKAGQEYQKAIGNVVKVKLMQSDSKSKTQYCVITSFRRGKQFSRAMADLIEENQKLRQEVEAWKEETRRAYLEGHDNGVAKLAAEDKLDRLINGLKTKLNFTFAGDRMFYGSDEVIDFGRPEIVPEIEVDMR